MRTVKYLTAAELLDGDRIQLSPTQCASQRLDPRSTEIAYEVLGRHNIEHPGPGGAGVETRVRFFGCHAKNSVVVTLEPHEEVVAMATVPRTEAKMRGRG